MQKSIWSIIFIGVEFIALLLLYLIGLMTYLLVPLVCVYCETLLIVLFAISLVFYWIIGKLNPELVNFIHFRFVSAMVLSSFFVSMIVSLFNVVFSLFYLIFMLYLITKLKDVKVKKNE